MPPPSTWCTTFCRQAAQSLYRPREDEQIPTIPVEDNAPESAITQESDAIAEEGR